MNKTNKLTLPTISPNLDKSEQGAKRKIFKGWIMNDTFSNWNKKSNKSQSPTNNEFSLAIETEGQEHLSSKSKLNTGITLGEYFRTRANTELSCN